MTPPPPMAENVHFLMLRYDPTSCPTKDCTQMKDVYVVSFFNVEMWPRLLSRKRIAQNMLNDVWNQFSTLKYDTPLLAEKSILQEFLYLGSFFNGEIWPPLLWLRRFNF
jgi:hypothetical protein